MQNLPIPRFTTLVLDIGDVLLGWTPQNTRIPSPTMRQIIMSPIWFAYERGMVSQNDCFSRISVQFDLRVDDVQNAFEQAHLSLTPKLDVLELVRDLKAQSSGMLRVLAMSNMPKPNFERLYPMFKSWNIFDDYYISAHVGERKPGLRFFHHVINAARFDPRQAIFVDDRLDNVIAARSLGMHGIVFDTPSTALRRLQGVFDEPYKRGWYFLTARAGNFHSTMESGDKICENFSQLLILEATQDSSLVKIDTHTGMWNFFCNGDIEFPCDLDTTALALSIISPDAEKIHSVMDDMLTYVDEDGIIQAYFDHGRPRTDPVVCTNVLALFAKYGRDHELQKSFDWIHNVLLHRAYVDGTRYYTTPECFFYFLSRLLSMPGLAPDKAALLKPLLKQRIYEHVGTGGDALAISMRILASVNVGLQISAADKAALLSHQNEDGGWNLSWFYRKGRTGNRIGNRGVTTALALRALREE